MKKRLITYKHELRQLLKHKRAIAVVLFVCLFIAALFSSQLATHNFNLGDTSHVKIALVNEDKGLGDNATLQERNLFQHLFGSSNELNAAQSAINLIKDDNTFEWIQVSSNEYREQIQEGRLYAAFVFPASYSDDIISSLAGTEKKPNISYVTFKKNSIQALESSSQPSPIDSKVNREFYQGILSNLTSLVRNATDKAVSLDSNTTALGKTGLEGALNDFASITKSLQGLQGATDRWSSSYDELKRKLEGIEGNATTMIERLEDAKTRLESVRRDIYRLGNAYAGAIFQGSVGLSNELNSSSEELKNTAKDVSDKQKDLAETIKDARSVLSKNRQLAETLKRLEVSSTYVTSLEDENKNLSSEISELEKLSTSLQDFSMSIDSSATSLANKINQSIDGQRNRSTQFNNDIYPKLETALDQIAYSIGELRGSLVTLETHTDKELSVLSQLGTFLSRSKEALDAPLRTLENARNGADSARSDIEALSTSDLLRKSHQLFRSDSNDYMTYISSNIEGKVSHQSDSSTYFKAEAAALFAIFLGIAILIFTLLTRSRSVSQGERSIAALLAQYSSRLGVLVTLCVVLAIIMCLIMLAFGIVPENIVFLVLGIVVFALCGTSLLYAVQFLFPQTGKGIVLILGLMSLLFSVGVVHPHLFPTYLQTLIAYTPVSFAVPVIVEPMSAMNMSMWLQAIACLIGTTLLGLFLILVIYTATARFDIHALSRFSLLVRPLCVTDGELDYQDAEYFKSLDSNELSSNEHDEANMTARSLVKEYRAHNKKYKQVKIMLPVIIVGLIIGSCLLTYLLNLSLQDRASVVIIDALVFIAAAAYGVVVESEHSHLTKQFADAGIDTEYILDYSYSDIQHQDVQDRLRAELDNEEYFPHKVRSYPTIDDSTLVQSDTHELLDEDDDETSLVDEEEDFYGRHSKENRGENE